MKECLFCKIAAGEISASKVYEDDKIVAFEDIEPAAPVHILLIPRTHIVSLNEADTNNLELLGHIQLVAAQLAKKMKIDKAGFRLVNNNGDEGGQEIPHLHYHLLGGRTMKWPPG
ncbi:MAG TPA: histidine triad nucleotide-binding protein [Syntrophomonadaceae bacterium]|mgnify:CR=1 FL=1|nr:histidine triad nucleotide-binding protein [Syntrophomonadaceae bacterium]HNX29214.1 histidine triad nucleotide-binding protein [Syntrophomonadaceae bacterium]HPR92582.1 histidine triad nucleotide-binding protein [Syntrophomonadaceae bacterium]